MKKILSIFILILSLNCFSNEIDDFFGKNIKTSFYIKYVDLSKNLKKEDLEYLKSLGKNKKPSDNVLFEEYTKYTGFTPEKDLKSVLVLVSDNINKNDKELAFIFFGNFDSKKTTEFFVNKINKVKTFKENKYKNINYYSSTKDKNTFSFFKQNILVMADEDFLKKVFDIYEEKDINQKNKSMISYYKQNEKEKISGVVAFNSGISNTLMSKQKMAGNLMSDVKKLYLKGDFAPDFKFHIDMECSDDENALKLSNELNKFKTIGAFYAMKFGLNSVVNKINITNYNKITGLGLSLTYSEIKNLLNILKNIKKQ